MAKVSQPELKRYLDKRVAIHIQGGRKVIGTLRGYDIFLNLVIDSAVEQKHPLVGGGQQAEETTGKGNYNQHAWVDGAQCDTVVSETRSRRLRGTDKCLMTLILFCQVIRGNSVNSLEGLDVVKTR